MALSSESNSLLDISKIAHSEKINVAIVYTEWNEKIVAEQLAGAHRIAEQTGAKISASYVVPGSVEIPYAVKCAYERVNLSEKPDAIIAFGAVIRGGTPHFDYVCNMVTEGITQLNLSLPIPVIFGVLTLENEAQAWERLGGAHGHKGEEAMIAAIKMAQLSMSF